MRRFRLSSVLVAASLFLPTIALAEPMVGLTTTGKLVSYDTTNPAGAAASKAVAGLNAGDKIVGIDFRPSTGVLYGLGSSKQLYSINVDTAQATAVGTPFATAVAGTDWDIDFNPQIDRIRFVTSSAENNVLNPANNAITTNNALAYTIGDANCVLLNCPAPVVTAVGYTQNRGGTQATALWGVDANHDTLIEITASNGQFSVVNTRATLKLNGATLNITNVAGFDISPNGDTAFLTLNEAGGTTTKLYSTELTGGNAGVLTALGVIAANEIVVDSAVVPRLVNTRLWALYNNSVAGTSTIYPVATQAPLALGAAIPVTGLGAGETILTIDERPSTGGLYGLSSAKILYKIDTTTGAVTPVGAANGIDVASGVTIDFNPSADRVRVLTGGGLSYRLHPDTGAVAAQDANLAYAAGDTNAGKAPSVFAAAYTHPVPSAPATSLYNLDLRSGAGNATLASQGSVEGVMPVVSPNDGVLYTVGGLLVPRVATETRAALDIGIDGTAYAFWSPDPAVRSGVPDPVVARLYQVDLATGAARYGIQLPAGAANEAPVDFAVDLPVPPPPGSDAGVPDSGASDAATSTDATTSSDAGTKADSSIVLPDSGPFDGGAPDAGTVEETLEGSDGCSVGTSTGNAASGGLAVVGLALVALRRRKRA